MSTEEIQMPPNAGNTLMIVYGEDGINPNAPNWRIQVANDPNTYAFMGETEQEQRLRIQRLGEDMQQYAANPAVLEDELGVLIDWPAGMTTDDMMGILFEHTTQLAFEEEIIYTVPVAVDALIDTMVAAGEALLEVLMV